MSPLWSSTLVLGDVAAAHSLEPLQTARIALDARPWAEGKGVQETFAHVAEALGDVLHGRPSPTKPPPPLDVKCSPVYQPSSVPRLEGVHCVAEAARRRTATSLLEAQYIHIPRDSHRYLFPLYHPNALDIVIHWSLPSEQRTGMLVLSNQLTLGASHGAFDSILESAASGKTKRTMYAETQRAQLEIVQAVRASEWNREMNPLVVSVASATATHDFAQGCANHSHARVSLTLQTGRVRSQSSSQYETIRPRILPISLCGC